MYGKEERRETMSVTDKPTEFWMKIVSILMALILVTGSSIGTLLLNRMDSMKSELKEFGRTLTETLITTGVLSERYQNLNQRVTVNEKNIDSIKERNYGKR